MNSSMRRASFVGMYCATSNSRTAPPKRVGKAETSKRVTGAMPLSPRRMASHADWTVLPTGDTRPRPVMTTRRLLTRFLQRPEEGSGLAATFVDVIDSLMDGGDLLGVLVGDLDLEFLFQSHDELDCVERIGPKIVHERCIVRDLFLFDAQLFGNDGFDLLLNCAH